jgi:hypothetical protein
MLVTLGSVATIGLLAAPIRAGLRQLEEPAMLRWEEIAWPGVLALAVIGALALAIMVSSNLLAGRLGGVQRNRVRRLQVAPTRRSWAPALWIAAALALWSIARLSGALAGSVRAVDASAQGIEQLWAEWLVRLSLVVGCGLVVAGGFELWFERRRLWQALHQTPEQSRGDRDARRR